MGVDFHEHFDLIYYYVQFPTEIDCSSVASLSPVVEEKFFYSLLTWTDLMNEYLLTIESTTRCCAQTLRRVCDLIPPINRWRLCSNETDGDGDDGKVKSSFIH